MYFQELSKLKSESPFTGVFPSSSAINQSVFARCLDVGGIRGVVKTDISKHNINKYPIFVKMSTTFLLQ